MSMSGIRLVEECPPAVGKSNASTDRTDALEQRSVINALEEVFARVVVLERVCHTTAGDGAVGRNTASSPVSAVRGSKVRAAGSGKKWKREHESSERMHRYLRVVED